MATLLEVIISGPLGKVIARLRAAIRHHHHHDDDEEPESARPKPPIVPNRITTPQLDKLLAVRITGNPADGSHGDVADDSVIWVDGGDELVVHLTSIATRIERDALIVAIDVECDQTGRQTIVVPFVVGSDPSGGIVLVCEDLPRGPDAIVQRWGKILQRALYASLIDLAELHAIERGGKPKALFVRNNALELVTEGP